MPNPIKNNPLGDFGDQIFEQLDDVKETLVNETKSLPKAAKQQLQNNNTQNNQDTPLRQDSAGQANDIIPNRKTDPITGKPMASKKMANQVAQQANQLAMMKLKKLREELDKQRLKIDGPASASASAGEAGPEIPVTKKPTEDDGVVARALKNAKSTGESRADLVG